MAMTKIWMVPRRAPVQLSLLPPIMEPLNLGPLAIRSGADPEHV